MKRIAKFEKVSYKQFKEDFKDCYTGVLKDENKIREIYNDIILPKRATSGSAGYDFFAPFDIVIPKNKSVKIPTGIRCCMENGWVLKEYPRSGHGFKYGVHLANTVGIIDSDYCFSDNEGHIFMKLNNESILAKKVEIKKGEAFCQGIFVEFGITVDDDTKGVRNGGFGSTSSNEFKTQYGEFNYKDR